MIKNLEIEVLTPEGKRPLATGTDNKFDISMGLCRGKPAITMIGGREYLGLEIDRIAKVLSASEAYEDRTQKGIVIETKEGSYFHIHNGTSRITDLRLQLLRQRLKPRVWLNQYT
jgi:hypothetical protein